MIAQLRTRKPIATNIDDRRDLVDATLDPEASAVARGEQGRIDKCMEELAASRQRLSKAPISKDTVIKNLLIVLMCR